MAIDEILQVKRNVTLLQIAAPAQLNGNVGRDIFRLAFGVLKLMTRTGLYCPLRRCAITVSRSVFSASASG